MPTGQSILESSRRTVSADQSNTSDLAAAIEPANTPRTIECELTSHLFIQASTNMDQAKSLSIWQNGFNENQLGLRTSYENLSSKNL
jgi:hypothetical protein